MSAAPRPRLVVVGGTGTVGVVAARAVRDRFGADRVRIVGRDPAWTAALGARPGVAAEPCDVTLPGALAALLRPGDLVLNAAAPYFRLGDAVARACVEAGCDYADLCDDWRATAAILALDGAARARGVRLITGFGLAPGLTNLLAVTALAALERAETLIAGWGLDLSGGGGRDPDLAGRPSRPVVTGLLHFLDCCVDVTPMRRDGVDGEEPPLRPVPHHLPGLESHEVVTIGSPEGLTLRTSTPGLRDVLPVMVAPPAIVAGLRGLAEAVRAGHLSLEDGARLLATPTPPADGSGEAVDPPPPPFAVAIGWAGGAPSRVWARARRMPDGGFGAVGQILAAAASLFLEDRLSGGPGARPIEAFVAPSDYWRLLAPLCGVSDPAELIELRVTPAGDAPAA